MALNAFEIVRFRQRRASSWKNGGGVTREIAAFPAEASLDQFAWRISLADVTAAGPFSRFDGIDRVLTVLEGALQLDRDGDSTVLQPLMPHGFAGDVAVHGMPVGGAVRDLNVMVRRGEWRAEVYPLPAGGAVGSLQGAEVALLLALAPQASRIGGETLALGELDAVLFDAGAPDGLGVEAAAIAVGLWRTG